MGKIVSFKRREIQVGDFVLFRDTDASDSERHEALVVGLSVLADGREFAILCRLDIKRTVHVPRGNCTLIRKKELTGGLTDLAAASARYGCGKVVGEIMENNSLHVILQLDEGKRTPLIPIEELEFRTVWL